MERVAVPAEMGMIMRSAKYAEVQAGHTFSKAKPIPIIPPELCNFSRAFIAQKKPHI